MHIDKPMIERFKELSVGYLTGSLSEQEAEELCSNVDMLDDPRMQIGAVLGYLGRKQKFRMDRCNRLLRKI